MNYNTGNVLTGFYNQKQEILEKIATDFSEGNIILKNLLLTLWKQGIETVGCCNGHKEKKQLPYISIKSHSNISLYIFPQIIEKLIKELQNEIEISIMMNEDDINITFYTTEENKNTMFKIIKEIEKTSWKITDLSHLMLDILNLNQFIKNTDSLIYEIKITKESIYIAFAQKGSLIIFNNNTQDINSIFDNIKNKNIPLQSDKIYLCTKESFNQLVNLLYEHFVIQQQENTNKRL